MNIELEVLADLLIHISEVKENIASIRNDLEKRGIAHDRSKFETFEFDSFAKTRQKFKTVDFGTKEYQECVDEIKPAIDHHYAANRHHTAYHFNGFNDMNLIDILEMLADWKAASRRSPGLRFVDSLPGAYRKYDIPENMQKHIESTLTYLGWI